MDYPQMAASLQRAGHRLTRPRRAVMRVLAERPREHLSAEDIHDASHALGEPIDLASVYRTINLLGDLGLVHRRDLAEPHTHFEIVHEQEVHLTCTTCGRTLEDHSPYYRRLLRSLQALAGRQGFNLGRFRIEAEGQCAACLAEAGGGR